MAPPPSRSGSGSGSSRPVPVSTDSSTPATRPSSSPTRTAADSTTAPAQLKFGEHTSRPGSASVPLPGPSRRAGTALLAFPAPPPSASSRRPPSGRGSSRSPSGSAVDNNMDSGFQTVAKKGKGRNAKKDNVKQTSSPSPAPASTDSTSHGQSPTSLNGDTASESSQSPAALDPLSIKPLKRKLSARKIPDTASVVFPQLIEQALASRSEPLSSLTFGTIPARSPSSASPTLSSSSPTSSVSQPAPQRPAASPAAARNPSPARVPVAGTHQLPPKPTVGPMPPAHVQAGPTHRASSPASKSAQPHAPGPTGGVSPAQSTHQPQQPPALMPHAMPSPHYGPQHASATPSPVTPHAPPQMHPGAMPPHYQQQPQQQFQHGGPHQHQQQQPPHGGHHSSGSYGQSGYGNNRGSMQGHGGYKNQRSGPNNRNSGSQQQQQYGTPQQQQQSHYHNLQQQQQGPHNAPYQQQQQHQPPTGPMLHAQPPQAQSNQSTPTPTPTSTTVPPGMASMYAGMPMAAAGTRPGANMPPQGMMMAAAIPGMPQGVPMMMPQYVGPDGQVMMGYYYAMPQMPQPQQAVPAYASTPSQLLAQMKAQQQQQQPSAMYPPPAPSVPYVQPQAATGPGSSTNRPPPPGQPTSGISAPASSTTVAGMVLPTGVNVPQQQPQPPVPAHQPPPGLSMAATAPVVASGMMGPTPPMHPMASTSPPLLPHGQLAGHSPITAGSPTPPLPTTTRPTIRIASKDDPTKTIQLTELATKATRSHRGSTAGLSAVGDHASDVGMVNDTASMTASSVGGGGAAATTPDGAPTTASQDGRGDETFESEAKLIAHRQMEENQRRGTKALEIKRPEHPRNGTPSPRPGSSPVVGKSALATVVAQGTSKSVPVQPTAENGDQKPPGKDKARSKSRSKSPAQPVVLEAQGGVIGTSHPIESVEPKVTRAVVIRKPNSPSPARSPPTTKAAPTKPRTPSPAKDVRERPASPAKQVKERPVSPVKEAPRGRSSSPVKPVMEERAVSPPAKETKRERSASPGKEVKQEQERPASPASKAKKDRSPSPPPKEHAGKSPSRSKSPSPVRSGPSSPKHLPTAEVETPEPIAVQSSPRARAASPPPRVTKPVAANAAEPEPERATSPARSTVSDLEEGEIRASPTTGEYPAVTQSADADEHGVFRYSRTRLTELCLPDLPLPNGINLAVFADLRGSGRGGSSAGYERGPGGMSRGGGASGSSRGGMRLGMPERSMSTPTPYQGGPGSGVSTPTRERRPMPMPPGAAAAAAMAASSSGRSMSGRGESRRDGSRRGTDRDAASGDREKRGSRRGTKRTGTADESASSSSMSLPSHQPPQLAVTGAALQPSERAHGARGVEVLPEDLKPLEKSSTAWVPESVLQKVAPGALPTPASADGNLSEGEMEVQREAEYCAQVEKQMRGVLNKLTPENMEKLQPRFAESLKYPSALKLIGRLIVRKSFDEPKYASLYASLTLYMYHHVKPLEGMPNDPEGHKAVRSAVRRIIIHECQDQFSRRPKWAHLAKGSISEEQFEEVVKIKSKVLGNMRFVAELFNYNVISKKVMHGILLELTNETQEPAEEDLECLIVLITTTSQYLRDSLGKKALDEIFNDRIVPITQFVDLIPRIKFALMDLISLWRNNFVKPKPPAPSAAQASAAASSVSRQDSREFNRRGEGRGGDSRYGGQSGGGSSGRYERGERSDRYDRSGTSNDYRNNDRGNRSDRGPRESRGGERGGYERNASGYERPDRGERSERYGAGDRSERGDRSWSSQQGGGRRGGDRGERGGDRSSRYGTNEQQQDSGSRASPEGGYSRGGPSARSSTASNRGGSTSRAPAGASTRSVFGVFGALLDGGGDDDSEEEPTVRKILARPSPQASSATLPKRTKSPQPAQAVKPAVEITTEEQAISRVERAMKEFMTNFDYQELADQFKKYALDVVPAAIGRSIEIITEEKEKQVRLYGQGLATAVKEGIVPADVVISGILSSMIMEEYDDMKVDIPQLDTLTTALCEELAKAMDNTLVAPLLAKVSSA